ncbi:MAG: type III-A CRISPR-associated protein Csm2 [Candidatus Binataceae bacterium]
MADMRDKLRGAGIPVTEGRRREDERRSGGGNVFPPGYPQYFTKEGHTRVEVVKEEAERTAEQFARDKLTRHQLRAFYGHSKKQLQRLQYGTPFAEVHFEVARLKAFAADRAARANPIPPSFKEFIERNVDAIRDEKSFEKGFIPHFEAVVAYCARLRD